ncbi:MULTISPECIES: TetR/AcrR family transcriptional regulator [Gordonia]|uniref:TetR/AcrR family transcriptional regulator n=2 Tax=Gordonia TaxID=2053 RepID=A0ABN3H1G6_9ACTN|nr:MULTISPECIES: TetR/AcrR family transcriptional regulator [Gordonia]KJR10184.1 TetR family transcriptional regulator [Gordonia sihwensis]KXT57129.1 TetR family transcriptional regulator [Gordonia sp. QH-12]MBY4569989.1 TetR family transcriptional regulator [Gordonia sihwensis]WFN93395.1 helix-turn-helix domain containing protein [Gordonia sihwensis]GAC59259.1 putative TetR family transcriptional regulator [Gordonia sihwensis NBRC 108236]
MSTPVESAGVAAESTRRRLSPQQAEKITKMTEAAVEILAADGFDALSVRDVAKRAGVAPATAYTYFSSKSHLVAEVFWRRLAAGVPEVDASLPRAERVAQVLRGVSTVVAGEGQLGGAVTVALLGSDPDSEHLRWRIGGFIHDRLAAAVGDDHPDAPRVVDALQMLYAGGLVTAGMGHLTYEATSERLVAAAALLFND